jgi:HD-like signal output (HDOD) protein
VDQLHLEWAEPHHLSGRQVLERRVGELVLVELGADHRDRQHSAVDHRRLADLAQHVGKRAHVVLVAVGEDDRLDVFGTLAEVGEVGQDEVDAQHFRGREHQSRVDDDDPPVVLDDGHVLPDLAQASERQYAEGLGH